MSKQLKLNDEAYSKLRELADMHHRTLGGQIEWLIDGSKVGEKTYVKNLGEDGTPELNDPKSIVGIIKLLSDEVASADKDNQDPDYWDTITEKRNEIQRLWDLWHKVTGK